MNPVIKSYTVEQIKAIKAEAMEAANTAAMARYDQYGDTGACGFAWVEIYDVKGNTKVGRNLKAAGITQNYARVFHIWNPSRVHVQSVDVLETGASAAADVFRKYGFNAYAGSRLD